MMSVSNDCSGVRHVLTRRCKRQCIDIDGFIKDLSLGKKVEAADIQRIKELSFSRLDASQKSAILRIFRTAYPKQEVGRTLSDAFVVSCSGIDELQLMLQCVEKMQAKQLEYAPIVEKIYAISPHDRATLLNFFNTYLDLRAIDSTLCSRLFRFFAEMHVRDRDKIIALVAPYLARCTSTEQVNTFIQLLVTLPQTHREVIAKIFAKVDVFLDLSAYATLFKLCRVESLNGLVWKDRLTREDIHSKLREELQDERVLRRSRNQLASFVIIYMQELGLTKQSALFKVAMDRASQIKMRDVNPYKVFKQHLECGAVEFSPRAYTIGGQRVAISPKGCQEAAALQGVLRRENMPPEITAETWGELVDPLRKSGNKIPKGWRRGRSLSEEQVEKILTQHAFGDLHAKVKNAICLHLTGQKFDHIRSPMEESLLHNILAESKLGAVLTVVQAQFVSLLSFLKMKSPIEVLKVCAGIQNCSEGRLEGIARMYHWLPDAYKMGCQVDASGNQHRSLGLAYLARLIQDILAVGFTDQGACMKRLVGIQGEVKEGVHHTRYLKNLIGPTVGLVHTVEFDLHVGVVSEALRTKTVKKALQIFYSYVTPKAIVNQLVEAFNTSGVGDESAERPNLFKQFSGILSDDETLDLTSVWSFNDADEIQLTKAGAVEILVKAGYLQVLTRPRK